MSKKNQKRALTLQQSLEQANLREHVLAYIIYELLPKETADATIKEAFEAVQAEAPTTLEDLKRVVMKAVDTVDKKLG